jgi:hypothetical protein
MVFQSNIRAGLVESGRKYMLRYYTMREDPSDPGNRFDQHAIERSRAELHNTIHTLHEYEERLYEHLHLISELNTRVGWYSEYANEFERTLHVIRRINGEITVIRNAIDSISCDECGVDRGE